MGEWCFGLVMVPFDPMLWILILAAIRFVYSKRLTLVKENIVLKPVFLKAAMSLLPITNWMINKAKCWHIMFGSASVNNSKTISQNNSENQFLWKTSYFSHITNLANCLSRSHVHQNSILLKFIVWTSSKCLTNVPKPEGLVLLNEDSLIMPCHLWN